MTTPDMHNLSDEDRLIRADFLTLDPPLVAYPHLIFKASRRSLEFALTTMNAKGGLWGDTLPFDADGNENATEEWPVVQQFHLWEKPRNQEHLLGAGWVGSATEFRMVIAAKTKPELLAEMAAASTCLGEHPTFDWRRDFENLSLWISRLGWAYVPLIHGELDHALFITRKDDEHLCEALRTRFEAAGDKSAKLRCGQARVHWEGPTVL